MLVFNYSPSPQSWEFDDLYERSAREGMVHSAMMCGEHFDMADDYSDDCAADAVTWSCGGRENYQLSSRKVISIEPAGVFTIAAGERYAYDASRDAPFRSNMIIFPQWMARDVAAPSEFCDDTHPPSRLTTRLCHPGEETMALMNNIAGHCILSAEDSIWYTEQVTLLYTRLLQEQAAGGAGNIRAAKPSTSRELARRIDRAGQLVLETYRNSDLSIDDMAHAACISRFHFIRIFKDAKGVTPMQYVNGVRMEAGMRLLRESRLTIGEIANAVGYSDRAAFVRSFKRRNGVAPSTFKARSI